MTHYSPPAPPMADGQLVVRPHAMLGEIAHGRYGACCMCNGTCWTWWSDRAPSGYVPLHEGCVPKLVEYWEQLVADGDTEPERVFVPPSGRRGAYARRAPKVDPELAEPAPIIRVGTAANLPDDFTPGHFWRPGDDHNTPWTGLLETATGLVMCPAGDDRAHAEKVFDFYRLTRVISFSTVVVGGAVIAPDGTVSMSWGSVPSVDGPRWEAVRTLSEWRRCTGCSEVRWPGSWVTVEGNRCKQCQMELETADPREWPSEALFPGDQFVPESFEKAKKVTLPASARLKPTLSRGRLTSRR